VRARDILFLVLLVAVLALIVHEARQAWTPEDAPIEQSSDNE